MIPHHTRDTKKLIEAQYRNEVRRLHSYWPKEEISLEEASHGKLYISLYNGGTHRFSRNEVEDLLKRTPRYLWRMFTIPLLVRYEKIGTRSWYRVLGSPWQRRLAEIMLKGDYSYEGVELLNISEFRTIISRYRSLVFVSLSL